jgi:hypothetical protein
MKKTLIFSTAIVWLVALPLESFAQSSLSGKCAQKDMEEYTANNLPLPVECLAQNVLAQNALEYKAVQRDRNFGAPRVAPPLTLTQLMGQALFDSKKHFVGSSFLSLAAQTKIVIKAEKFTSRLRRTHIKNLLLENKLSTTDYCADENRIILDSTIERQIRSEPKVVWEILSLYCLTPKGATLVASEEIQIDWDKLNDKGLPWQIHYLSVVGLSQGDVRRKREHRYPNIVTFGQAQYMQSPVSIQNSFFKHEEFSVLESVSVVESRPLIIDPFGLVVLIKTMKLDGDNYPRDIYVVFDGKVQAMSLRLDFFDEGRAFNAFDVYVSSYRQHTLVKASFGGQKNRNLRYVDFPFLIERFFEQFLGNGQ